MWDLFYKFMGFIVIDRGVYMIVRVRLPILDSKFKLPWYIFESGGLGDFLGSG